LKNDLNKPFDLKILLLVLFLVGPRNGFTQDHLAIKNLFGKTIESFYPGDKIRFKLVGEKVIHEKVLLGVNAIGRELIIEGATIGFDRIKVIYSEKKHRKDYQNKLMAAGVILLSIDQVNNNPDFPRRLDFNQGISIASGVLFGAGLTIKLLRRHKYRLKGKYRLAVVF
jgi:hypothetical protein